MQITNGLNELAKSIAQRNDIIEKFGRNRQAVKMNLENQKKMDQIKESWNRMKKLVEKEKAKGKGVRVAFYAQLLLNTMLHAHRFSFPFSFFLSRFSAQS